MRVIGLSIVHAVQKITSTYTIIEESIQDLPSQYCLHISSAMKLTAQKILGLIGPAML